MDRIRLFASVLMAGGLAGCIMLPPPPPPMLHGPAPGFRGEGPPMNYGARRPPPPGWEASDGARDGCMRGMPGQPDGQAPGAR